MLEYINRAGWGALPPRCTTPLPLSRVDTIYVHYTAAFADEYGDPRPRMRGTQRYHMTASPTDVTKPWCDIAYSWAFARTGEILEGRGWNVKTAATGAENGHSLAFVFLGSDKEGRDDVTPKGRAALGKLINEVFRMKGREITIKGHTQAPGKAGETACPGAELLSYINLKGWRDEPDVISYPRRFYLFAAWYLGEGQFRPYGPRNRDYYPPELPSLYEVHKMAPYWAAIQIYVRRRKK